MLFAFLDESYIHGDVHLVGALVVTPAQLHSLNLALDEVIWKTHLAHPEVRSDVELHGQQLFQRSGDWSVLRPKPAVAFAIYRRALGTTAAIKPAWFIGGVRRIDRLAARYTNPWPPHQLALQYVLEQVDAYAKQCHEQVRIIADQVPDQSHHEARIRQFQINGRTPGWRSTDLSSIETSFRWEDSRHHRGLQAVDLLTYLYVRKRYSPGHPRTVAEVEKMSDIARPILTGARVWTP